MAHIQTFFLRGQIQDTRHFNFTRTEPFSTLFYERACGCRKGEEGEGCEDLKNDVREMGKDIAEVISKIESLKIQLLEEKKHRDIETQVTEVGQSISFLLTGFLFLFQKVNERLEFG